MAKSIGETRMERNLARSLDRPPASAAEVGSGDAQRTALAAKPASASHRLKPHRNWPCIGCAGPNQGYHPANDGPAEKEIYNENQTCVRFVAPNDGGEKIHEREE